MNIFNKERKSNMHEMRNSAAPDDFGPSRKSVRLNKENSGPAKSSLSKQKEEIDEAAKIVALKMKQLQLAGSMRGTQREMQPEYDSEDEETNKADKYADELNFPKRVARGKRESEFARPSAKQHYQQQDESSSGEEGSEEEEESSEEQAAARVNKQPGRAQALHGRKQQPEESDDFEEVSEDEEETDSEEEDSEAEDLSAQRLALKKGRQYRGH